MNVGESLKNCLHKLEISYFRDCISVAKSMHAHITAGF